MTDLSITATLTKADHFADAGNKVPARPPWSPQRLAGPAAARSLVRGQARYRREVAAVQKGRNA